MLARSIKRQYSRTVNADMLYLLKQIVVFVLLGTIYITP